ncbi:hypothetical protein Hanom_Chr12g01067891 [Helianthus anomalus]
MGSEPLEDEEGDVSVSNTDWQKTKKTTFVGMERRLLMGDQILRRLPLPLLLFIVLGQVKKGSLKEGLIVGPVL